MTLSIADVNADPSHGHFSWPRAVALACLAHCLLWSFGPTLFLGNLHTDTVEATSWATHWDFGYVKHPPLVVWLLNLILALPGARMLNDLLLSQATVGVAAALIWRTVRLYANQRAAALAVVMYLASPPATFFATQVNHNSLSIPFGAGILCFGLSYLQGRKSLDLILLGLVAGLGLLTKYQTAFFLITLIAVALAIPGYRWAWRDPRSYGGALICLLLFAPHLWWDSRHEWRTLLYAASDRPLRTIRDFGYGLNELLDGVLMSAVAPVLGWLLVGWPRPDLVWSLRARIGIWIAATPIIVMIALGFASGQILRQGWLIPLIPGLVIGFALIFAQTAQSIVLEPQSVANRSVLLSAGQVLLFAGFLLGRSAAGHPVAAYSLDGRLLANKVEGVWAESQSGPIPCILTPNRSFSLAIMLYLRPIPRVVDLTLSPHSEYDPFAVCRDKGGLVIVPDGVEFNHELNKIGFARRAIVVQTRPLLGQFKWTFQVYLIPPPR